MPTAWTRAERVTSTQWNLLSERKQASTEEQHWTQTGLILLFKPQANQCERCVDTEVQKVEGTSPCAAGCKFRNLACITKGTASKLVR